MFSKAKKLAEDGRRISDRALAQALNGEEREEFFGEALQLLINDRRIIPENGEYSLG